MIKIFYLGHLQKISITPTLLRPYFDLTPTLLRPYSDLTPILLRSYSDLTPTLLRKHQVVPHAILLIIVIFEIVSFEIVGCQWCLLRWIQLGRRIELLIWCQALNFSPTSSAQFFTYVKRYSWKFVHSWPEFAGLQAGICWFTGVSKTKSSILRQKSSILRQKKQHTATKAAYCDRQDDYSRPLL